MCICVCSSTCYMLSSKICIPLAKWGHLWEVRIFWLDFTALKHCLRLVLSLGLELGWGWGKGSRLRGVSCDVYAWGRGLDDTLCLWMSSQRITGMRVCWRVSCDIPGRSEPAEGSFWVNVFSGNIEASHDSLISAFGLFILSVLPMCCLHNI